MPMYDRRCTQCEQIKIDCYESISAPDVPCECGGVLERVHLPGRTNGVIDDSIPGGLWIKNGLCNPDGSPRRFDCHTDIRRAEQATGYTNYVVHKGTRGGDKSKHTSRWV